MKQVEYTGIEEEELKAVKSRYGLRRADRYTALVLTGLMKGFTAEELQWNKEETALILTSMFGPHRTVYELVNDIIDSPEDQILPTRFSHSVMNAACSYLGTVLHITGPTFAIANFDEPYRKGLQLGETLLASGQAKQALVLYGEEEGVIPEAVRSHFPGMVEWDGKDVVRVTLMKAGESF